MLVMSPNVLTFLPKRSQIPLRVFVYQDYQPLTDNIMVFM